MDKSPYHAFLLLNKDLLSHIHFEDIDNEIRFTWKFFHEVNFGV